MLIMIKKIANLQVLIKSSILSLFNPNFNLDTERRSVINHLTSTKEQSR